ncbi:hypothetical protein ERC79_10500 [Rhodococcus sp. ABRD24]|uniref:hypothetical protein n=1 Tax=Rhodococcus sp. ABRD24 TaxID=2507582 RepID=UPI001040767D|nr:hypothetical protein [Rhodococcus sp. ABRD24]QBJ96347.1 hypothetical protein ERC79_10500 [Rhodococcus sp. ABRD24]
MGKPSKEDAPNTRAVACLLCGPLTAVMQGEIIRSMGLHAVAVAGLTAAVASPFTWNHLWVWLVPLLVWTAARALSNTWWCLGVGALFCV